MEEHSLFLRTREFVALIGCSECDGEAHVIRRAPYPFEGLEFRTFECSECGNEMERVHFELRPLAGPPALDATPHLQGDAPDFVEVGEAGIAVDHAMRRQRAVQRSW